MEKWQSFFLALSLTLLIFFNLNFFQEKNYSQEIILERAIDGDTFVSAEGVTFRLININAPERGERGYDESKEFLAQFENETLQAETLSLDLYGRTLTRIFSDEYLNLLAVKNGYAKKFLVEKSELSEFSEAEKQAIENEKGNWKHSEFYGCFSSTINAEEEFLTLTSSCGEINLAGWTITDESRKKYKFPDISIKEATIYSTYGNDSVDELFWNSGQNVWNNDRDTLYLFDKNNSIAHTNSYGYNFFS